MISPTSTTKDYSLQPGLIEKHKRTMECISAIALWKRELNFFQKLLERYTFSYTAEADKKRIDHFQNFVIYYGGEVIPGLRKRMVDHERHLSNMLRDKNELDTEYFKEHDILMYDFESMANRIAEYKDDLFSFIEKAM